MVHRRAAFAFGLLIGTLPLLQGGPAAAQDNILGALFSPLIQLFGGNRRDVPEITVHPQAPGRGFAPRHARPRPTGVPRAYCVRLCDGYFFPAAASHRGDYGSQETNCSSLCPGAAVAVYTLRGGASIEEASDPHGQSYASLSTAFRYRDRIDRACSCSGQSTNGLARLPITHDFTLKPGDVVVTETGVRVFAGSSRFPYRSSDFVEARAYGRLPADVQRRVTEIQAGIRARETVVPANRPAGVASRRAAALEAAREAAPTATAPAPRSVRVLDMPRPEAAIP
jgi:Protein of unknown function (DUF2865)